MAIKVTLGATEKTQQDKPFPKLMMSKGCRIIFMTSDSIGFQLNDAVGDKPHFYKKWVIEDLFDYNDPITIQNQ